MARARKVDLNTANRKELMQISDIGRECADTIINERERRRGFRTLDELDDISGFGPKAMENLRREAFVSGPGQNKIDLNTASR